jgi:hypothetical protein
MKISWAVKVGSRIMLMLDLLGVPNLLSEPNRNPFLLRVKNRNYRDENKARLVEESVF